jgi:hypothetical protein
MINTLLELLGDSVDMKVAIAFFGAVIGFDG